MGWTTPYISLRERAGRRMNLTITTNIKTSSCFPSVSIYAELCAYEPNPNSSHYPACIINPRSSFPPSTYDMYLQSNSLESLECQSFHTYLCIIHSRFPNMFHRPFYAFLVSVLESSLVVGGKGGGEVGIEIRTRKLRSRYGLIMDSAGKGGL